MVNLLVTGLVTCTKCNIGFRNIYYPDRQLDYNANMEVYDSFGVGAIKYACPLYGIRGSSASKVAGSGTFLIRHSIKK